MLRVGLTDHCGRKVVRFERAAEWVPRFDADEQRATSGAGSPLATVGRPSGKVLLTTVCIVAKLGNRFADIAKRLTLNRYFTLILSRTSKIIRLGNSQS